MSGHTFRFAAQLGQAPEGTARSWAEQARRCEDLGYSALLMPDHFVDQLTPVPALAAVAAATTTLRLGSLVFGNDYRHPFVLAKEAATLDLLSEGRFELSLGAGWMKTDYEEAGLTTTHHGCGSSASKRQCRSFRGCCAPRVPSRSGAPITRCTSTASFTDRCKSRDHAWVKDAAGERFDSLELNALIGFVMITDGASGIYEAMAPAFGIDVDEARHVPGILLGTRNEMIEELQWRREEYGITYWSIEADSWKDLGPIVSKLSGT